MEDQRKKEDQLFKKKLKKAGLWFLIGAVSFFAAGYVPVFLTNIGCAENLATFFNLAFRALFVIGVLCSVFTLARALHDPLSERERKELEKKETLEKTGKEE